MMMASRGASAKFFEVPFMMEEMETENNLYLGSRGIGRRYFATKMLGKCAGNEASRISVRNLKRQRSGSGELGEKSLSSRDLWSE